jgi:hypothetical protein
MLGYAAQRYLAILVAMLLTGWAVVQAANPADFGLTPIAVRWIGVVMAMLGVLASVLPSIRGMSRDPNFLVNRVNDLDDHDREQVVKEIAPQTVAPQPDYPSFVRDITDELLRRKEQEANRG